VFDAPPRNHLGLHRQKQAGLFYAGLHVPVGRLLAEDLQDLAAAADGHGASEVRFTEDQNVILPGIAEDGLAAFRNDPLLQRFPLEPGAIAAGTVSCTGNTYCGFALTNTKDTALAMAAELDRELEMPAEVRIHWTGCPNSCGQAYMGAIGLTGTKARAAGGGMVEGYDITVGGSQGADPQIASLERKGVPASEVKEVIRELLIRSHGARPRARP
jgi:ferredoxin-nitrite reductase